MTTAHKPSKPRRWSKHVMETSDALDLDSGVFKRSDPKSIVHSLSAARGAKRRA